MSTMMELNAKISKSLVLKTFNESNIEQLGRCSVRIRHNNKCAKCRFFIVPGDGPALLRMPDIELLGIIRVMCERIGNKANARKFDMQTRHSADSQIVVQTGAHRQCQIQIMQVETKSTFLIILILVQTKLKCLIIFIAAIKKTNKRAVETITNRTHNEFM